jgi:phenylalanyl-tRNA synthetase beta chain
VKYSHDWLCEYVPIAEDPARVGARLTAAGLPLDGLEQGPHGAVYDFDIFPNRPDCMSHVGLAREYAALTGAALEVPRPRLPGGGPPTAGLAAVAIEAPDLCSRYAARCVTEVRIGASPAWLARRLESIGLRPINNLVDITNFVLWELGHPLHAFDLDRLEGRRIVVRRARPGELIVTLDGVKRTLAADMLVIADAQHPVALAGIMGGEASAVTDRTRHVLIESAWFDPISVRRTSRALGLRTDASHRFERGADPAIPPAALDRAAALIAEIAGGKISDPMTDVHPRPEAPRRVTLRPERAAALLGAAVPDSIARQALERRGFGVQTGGPAWNVAVPSFRRDVEREADLIEEVARHRGYDALPSELPLIAGTPDSPDPATRLATAVRRAFLVAGLNEAINYAMTDREDGVLFGVADPPALDNPLQSQASHLRGSLLGGLLRNVAHNLNHGAAACHLFEIGAVFLPAPGGGRPEERTRAAFAVAGRGLPIHWSAPRREVDLHDARGLVEAALELAGAATPGFALDKIPHFEAGRGLAISIGGNRVGAIGTVGGAILARYGIDRPVHAGEIDLAAIADRPAPVRRYVPLPRYPAIRRDLALVLRRDVTFEAVARVVRECCRLPIADLLVFDRYAGAGIPADRVSLAIQVVFQHAERTLTHEEVQEAQDAIVERLRRELGASLRGPGSGPAAG